MDEHKFTAFLLSLHLSDKVMLTLTSLKRPAFGTSATTSGRTFTFTAATPATWAARRPLTLVTEVNEIRAPCCSWSHMLGVHFKSLREFYLSTPNHDKFILLLLHTVEMGLKFFDSVASRGDGELNWIQARYFIGIRQSRVGSGTLLFQVDNNVEEAVSSIPKPKPPHRLSFPIQPTSRLSNFISSNSIFGSFFERLSPRIQICFKHASNFLLNGYDDAKEKIFLIFFIKCSSNKDLFFSSLWRVSSESP